MDTKVITGGDLIKKNISVGLLLLRKPIPVLSYARISECKLYNSSFFEVGLFYKPISGSFKLKQSVKNEKR